MGYSNQEPKASETAQRLKALAAKSDHLSLLFETHVVEGGN